MVFEPATILVLSGALWTTTKCTNLFSATSGPKGSLLPRWLSVKVCSGGLQRAEGGLAQGLHRTI